ncbi:hypothetical protein [Bradyrhizobium uaiense]|uniref:Uncharacterized protein n=1 Tax=Bradyrhizobium uaiense TaxID=2594946 RepID=A0A6P1BBG7_9BRAD|nr:hypothetical protein [Bradyrhizobium uaiense]NEU95669.1 hypothetical protein [Bradyrhizobium uaiense]
MDEEKLLEALAAIAEELRGDILKLAGRVDAVSESYNQLAAITAADAAGARDRGVDTSMRRRDEDDRGPDGTMAVRTAADARSDSVSRHEFAVSASSVNDMRKKQSRSMADLDAFADVQAKADSVMRALGSRAEPPMAGEDLVSYKIRQHRAMQKHSPKWKGVELRIIAGDQVALDNVLGEIRADAMDAATSPVGMPEFQHRAITETTSGGHTITRFVGNGTIFKQLSRPVRHVEYIGTRHLPGSMQ